MPPCHLSCGEYVVLRLHWQRQQHPILNFLDGHIVSVIRKVNDLTELVEPPCSWPDKIGCDVLLKTPHMRNLNLIEVQKIPNSRPSVNYTNEELPPFCPARSSIPGAGTGMTPEQPLVERENLLV